MSYKITIETTHDANEVVAYMLLDLGASGVSVNDPEDIKEIDMSGAVWDYLDENDLSGSVTVEGFFDDISEKLFTVLKKRLDRIRKNFPCYVGSLDITTEIVANSDWLAEWKKYYKPILLDNISIYPAWITPSGEKPYVLIEPGTAFGTGEHESTKMCLTMLTERDLKGKYVADIGCGSGILGMAALRLGASRVYFSDIDEQAIDNLKINLKLNGFDESRYEIRKASLLDGFHDKVDVLCANITADILMKLCPDIPSHLNNNAIVMISGVIRDREEEVFDVYLSADFEPIESLADKEWRAFTFKL